MSGFDAHVAAVEAACTRALTCAAECGEPFEAIVFHAGSLAHYAADDLEIPFRSHPHFARFAPIEGAGHFVVFRPGARTRLLRLVESDFWYAPPAPLEADVANAFDVVEADALSLARLALGDPARAAFVGADAGLAEALGIEASATNPSALLAALDWERAYKTDFEVACLREAQRIAARGHAAVREQLPACPSEFELHLRYLRATAQTEADLPYPSIIAWDEAGAVLHYQHRRRKPPAPARSFLIDAGARHLGYASDITRSYTIDDESEGVFAGLLDGVEFLQQRLASAVRPGTAFVDLHREAEREIACLLREAGILQMSVEQARAERVVFAFFPHGLGHHLGLQTHDVGGQQIDPQGTLRPPPEDCPHLRTTRDLAPRQVVTIEPGLYFVASLLAPLRERKDIDWHLVDALMPYGGIRIEDDVLVTEDASENLTRPHVPGHA